MANNNNNNKTPDDQRYTEEEQQHILNEWNLFANEPEAWADQYQDPELQYNILKEETERLRNETDFKALPGEDDVGDIVGKAVTQSMEKPHNQKKVADWAMLKGGWRGFSTLWNGAVFLGREAWDYENWLKVMDKVKALVDENVTVWEKGKCEDWAERTKRAGIKRNEDGFWESWGRAVGSRKDFVKYGMNPDLIEGSNEWSDWMFDKIPFENENLGFIGNAVEILTQEAMIMGPMAIMKLRKASKIADWFAMKAGAKMHGGKFIKGKDGTERLVTRTGDDAISHVDILSPNYKGRGMKGEQMSEAVKKKYDRALSIATREGSFGEWLGVKGGTNAYKEAEILTSLTVAVAGATMQQYVGRNYSVIGEVGAGLTGARLPNWIGRYGLDWMNWMRYSVNPLKSQRAKDDAFLRMMGFDIRPDGTVLDPNIIVGKNADGSVMYAEVPKGKIDALLELGTSRPGLPILGGGMFKGQTRKKLEAYRAMGDMVLELPSDMRAEYIDRVAMIDTLISKYDDGTGRLYATISQAINLDVMATIQTRAMANETLGKTVKVRFPVKGKILQKRLEESSLALADMLTQFPDDLWKNAEFRNLMSGFTQTIDNTLRRLEKAEFADIKNYRLALAEKKKVLLKQESDGKILSKGDVYELSSTPDGKLKYGNKIETTHDIRDELVASAGDRALIDKVWRSEGFYEVPVGIDKDGRTITKMWHKKDVQASRPIAEYEKSAVKLVDDAYDRDLKTGGKLYNALGDDYKVNSLGSVNANAAARITADLGIAIERTMGDVDVKARPIIKIPKFEGNIEQYLIAKRREAVDKVADEDLVESYNAMRKTALDEGNYKDFPTLERQVDDVGTEVEKATTDVEDIRDAMTKAIDVALPDNVAQHLNMTLEDLVRIRSSLYKFATKSYRSKDKLNNQGIDALLQFRVANQLSESLNKFKDDDLFAGWKVANDNWKKEVGNRWNQGLAYKLIAHNSRGDRLTGSGKIFDKFLDASGDYGNAANVFRSIFRNIEGDASLHDDGMKLLNESILRRVEKDGAIDGDFWSAFQDADLLNLGAKSSDEAEAIGQSLFRPLSKSKEAVESGLSPIDKRIDVSLEAEESILRSVAKSKYGFEDLGIRFEELEGMKNVTNEAQFRKIVLDSTYRGGNPQLALAVFRKIKGNHAAEQGFFRMLYDGAAEDAFAKAGEKGGFRYDVGSGTFQGNMKVNANAYQTYLQRNSRLLKEVFDVDSAKLVDGTTIFDRMEELGSVLQLVGGEITKATVEGLPKHFRVEQIISRVYSIARGVVSPRYVMTELLIQDARFRRGKLIEQIATDPDAALIISEIVSKNGLRNPQTRKDFTRWWLESMIRVARGDNPEGPGSKLGQYYMVKDRTSDAAEFVSEKTSNVKEWITGDNE